MLQKDGTGMMWDMVMELNMFLQQRFSRNIELFIRREFGGNVSDFARKANLDRKTVHHWLSGTALPSSQRLFLMRERTGLDLNAVLTEDWVEEARGEEQDG